MDTAASALGNLRGWGRRKTLGVLGHRHPGTYRGIIASTLDYAGVHGVYVLDRETGDETTRDAVVPLGRAAVLEEMVVHHQLAYHR